MSYHQRFQSRGRVIASAWSKDGRICYLRIRDFPGLESPGKEYIYAGELRGASVQLNTFKALDRRRPWRRKHI